MFAKGAFGSAIACHPFGRWTVNIATNIVIISGMLIKRVKRPNVNSIAPRVQLLLQAGPLDMERKS